MVLLLLSIAVVVQITANATASPQPLLDDQTLTTKAIELAQQLGLQGSPTLSKTAHMSLGEWVTLNGEGLGTGAANFGLTPDIPVFVLAMRGHVVFQGPGLPRPGQTSPDEYDNITIALDARNGRQMGVVFRYPGFPMPIPLPEITLVPSQTPTPTPTSVISIPTAIPLPKTTAKPYP